jgi:hypothetical protein
VGGAERGARRARPCAAKPAFRLDRFPARAESACRPALDRARDLRGDAAEFRAAVREFFARVHHVELDAAAIERLLATG